MNRTAAAGAILLIAGMLLVVIGGTVLQHAVLPCNDILAHGKLYVQTSIGPRLPTPVLQHCKGGTSLFLVYFAGYLIAACGTILLVLGRLSTLALGIVTCIAVGLATAVPFLPNTDPYAYALYAYEGFVLHLSPYIPHSLSGDDTIAATLSAIFPSEQSDLRVSNYGAAFTGLYCLVVGPFGLVSLKAMIVAERVLGAVLILVLAWLMSLTQSQAVQKKRAFIAIALNPLLLFESISFGHGDVMMLVLLAGAYLAFRRNSIVLCTALCVVALETRGVAALALPVLFRELFHRKAFAEMRTAALALLSTVALTIGASVLIFDSFSIGSAYGFGYLSSPATILAAWLFGNNHAIIVYGTVVELGFAALIGYAALRERLYVLVPIAGLAALPIIAPWYLQWVAPIAILTSNRAFRAALVALLLLAPLQAHAELVAGHGQQSEILIVALQWLIPILTYVALRRSVWRHAQERVRS